MKIMIFGLMAIMGLILLKIIMKYIIFYKQINFHKILIHY
jgi:hypothetical protein